MTLQEFMSLDHRFSWEGLGYVDGAFENNCFTFPATWIEMQTGVDVAAAYRGLCRNQADGEALVASHGGLVALAEKQLSTVGARRVQNPASGDVGVIAVPEGAGDIKHVGAIRFGPMWAFLSPARVVSKKAEFVAAWRLCK